MHGRYQEESKISGLMDDTEVERVCDGVKHENLVMIQNSINEPSFLMIYIVIICVNIQFIRMIEEELLKLLDRPEDRAFNYDQFNTYDDV